MARLKPAEMKGRGYSTSIPFDAGNRKINILKFHDREGITEELIVNSLKNVKEKHRNVHNISGSYVSSYFVTVQVSRYPPIRLTVVFRESENDITVTNSFLGGINYKNLFEKRGLL